MIKDSSYGIIPLRRSNGRWQVLLVQHLAGHWGFPKGHAEFEETPLQAAERELKEETSLIVSSYLKKEPFIETYVFSFQKQIIQKTVEYFLAEVEGLISLRQAEIIDSRWVFLSDSQEWMTFEEGRKICLQVESSLRALKVERYNEK